ncbi:unnamed protein product [Rhizophagus irregularis]|nr:unnamed protein product [Rhizophagus irregularis]
MTKKHEKHEKHEKKKKSGKQYHSNIESSDSEKPEAKMRKTNKLPTLIDFVEDEERNIVNDNDNDPIQQDERDNDQTAFQEQVEELSWLIQKIMKGKQKAANPKDMIIDWSEVELRFSRKEPIFARSSKSAPPPSSSSSSSLSSSPSPSPSPSPSSSFSSSNSSFLHYVKMDRDLRTALRNEIAGIMDQLLEDKALNTKKTFDSQRKLVQNNIIPVVQKTINKNIFSVSDEDDNKIQEDDNKIQEDDNKSQEDDDKSHKSQEDDDATGGEKNEDQEKKQDEEVDDRKLKKEKEKCKSCFGRIR